MGKIYKITNTVNGHLYIGQTTSSLEERMKKHRSRFYNKEQNTGLYKAMEKYGIENFEISLIEDCPDEKLDEREKYWISYFNTYAGEGYNLTPGGQNWAEDFFALPMEEICEKYKSGKYTVRDLSKEYGRSESTISRRLKGQGIEVDRHPQTEKAIKARNENLAKGRIGGRAENFIAHVEKTKKKVARLSPIGEVEKLYDSLSDACRDLGQSTKHTNRITTAINSGGLCFGYHWNWA